MRHLNESRRLWREAFTWESLTSSSKWYSLSTLLLLLMSSNAICTAGIIPAEFQPPPLVSIPKSPPMYNFSFCTRCWIWSDGWTSRRTIIKAAFLNIMSVSLKGMRMIRFFKFMGLAWDKLQTNYWKKNRNNKSKTSHKSSWLKLSFPLKNKSCLLVSYFLKLYDKPGMKPGQVTAEYILCFSFCLFL